MLPKLKAIKTAAAGRVLHLSRVALRAMKEIANSQHLSPIFPYCLCFSTLPARHVRV